MEKFNRKNVIAAIVLAVAVLITVLVVYCQQHSKKEVTLGIFVGSPWSVPDAYTYEFVEEAIKKFEADNPDVTVSYVSGIQREDYSEWLSGKLISGDAPDVFMILPEDFGMLERVGAIKRLDSVIAMDSKFDESNYYSSAYNFGKINEEQYALPMEAVPDMMFVNKTLLAKETILMPDSDWTWDEFYAICEAVTKDTDQNGTIDQFGVYNYNWEHAFITNGVKPFETDGNSCDFQGEGAIEAVDFIKKLDGLNQGAMVTASDFDMGNVAFMPLTLAEYRTYKPYPWSIKKYSNFDWECVTLPRGPHGENVSMMNTLLMGMNARTKNEQLAWELMKTFCYDSEIQLEIYKYRSGGAVVKQILEEENSLLIENQALPKNDSINVRMIHNIMDQSLEDYNFIDVETAKNMISAEMKDIVDNDKNASISLKNLQRQVNQYLSK